LTTLDGRPVPNATVAVDTLDIWTPPSDNWRGSPIHRFETRTDPAGRWNVPDKIGLRVGIPAPDAMPLQLDEYTFTAPDGSTLRRRPSQESWRPKDEPAAALRTDWNAAPPASASILPAFGVTGGAAQTVSAHVGALILVGRPAFALGLRVAAEAGVRGAGGSAALVVPYRASMPCFGLELGARTLRPWSNGESREWIAPEVALDLLCNVRFTLTIPEGASAAFAGQGAAFGIGWGFF
jgi:hypothetical protein